MKKIKKSLLSLAVFCTITSSANAYTINKKFQMFGESNYTITFYPILPDRFFPTEQTKDTKGSCSFCWKDNCYWFTYSFDGEKTIYVDKIGIYIMFEDTLFELPFTKSFDAIK